jgi:hypothetical protein
MDYSGSCRQRPGSECVPFDPALQPQDKRVDLGLQTGSDTLTFMSQSVKS